MDNAFDLTPIKEMTAEPIPMPEIPPPSWIAKKIVGKLVSGAVSATVVSLIHQNTTTYSRAQTVQLYVGAWVIGAMVADKAADYIENEIAPTLKAVEDWLWIPVEEDEPELVYTTNGETEFVSFATTIPTKQ